MSRRYVIKDWGPADAWWLCELASIRPALSWGHIHKHYNCQHGSLKRKLREMGVEKPEWANPPRNGPRDAKIVAKYAGGKPVRGVAAEMGLTPGVIAGVAHRNGIKHGLAPAVRVTPPAAYQEQILPKAKIRGFAPPVRLAHARAHQCRWPLWDLASTPDKTVCGLTVPSEAWRRGIWYCQAHFEMGMRDGVSSGEVTWHTWGVTR